MTTDVDRLHELGLYAPDDPPGPVNSGRSCELCGCTDDNACIDEATGAPCWWVSEVLCSRCHRIFLESPPVPVAWEDNDV